MSYWPNYKLAAQKAIEVLEDSEISQAPIVLSRILDRYSSEIKIVPYSRVVKQNGIPLAEVIKMFNSDLGACIYEPSTNHYLVYYNDIHSKEWCRFTIAHEIGHIFLEHLQKAGSNIFNAVSIPEEDYKAYEKEANVFARNLLSPAPLAEYIVDDDARDHENWDDLQSAFWITERAAQIRLYYISRDLKDYDSEMYAIAGNIKMQYKRHCQVCKNTVPKGAKFCISCGSSVLEKSNNFKMLPPNVKHSERGLFFHCIQCGNEEMNSSSWFCRICGAPVVNLCYGIKDPKINKRHINPSNALFCGACGNRTVFNKYKVPMRPEEVPSMKYTDGVEYDRNTMRVKICPRCQNEEFDETATFCKICGLDLYNYCEGEQQLDETYGQIYYINRHANPSNARFCEKCGKKTTFLKEKILVDYENYQRRADALDALGPLFNIPDGIDEELPFS